MTGSAAAAVPNPLETRAIYAELTALVSVIVIDLVLAGDNAVVVGMAAAGLPRELRKKAIVIGIAAAALLRIVFALFTTRLLEVSFGLVLGGGLLLLWVAWKLFRETRRAVTEAPASSARRRLLNLTGGEPLLRRDLRPQRARGGSPTRG